MTDKILSPSATDDEKIERILSADPWLTRLTADDSPLGIMVELTQRESISQGALDASANCAAHWRDLRRQLALRSLPSGDGRRFHAEVLRVVEKLIPDDPAPDSTEGQILVALTTAVETYEKSSSTRSETGMPNPEPIPAYVIVQSHRRHVELSPGVGKEIQDYALAVCDDIISDLLPSIADATPSAIGTSCGELRKGDGNFIEKLGGEITPTGRPPEGHADDKHSPFKDECIRLACLLSSIGDGLIKNDWFSRTELLTMQEALRNQGEATPSAIGTPIEETEDSQGDWQCRDYADGWITFPTRKAAEKYQRDTGALMRYVRRYEYVSPPVTRIVPHDETHE